MLAVGELGQSSKVQELFPSLFTLRIKTCDLEVPIRIWLKTFMSLKRAMSGLIMKVTLSLGSSGVQYIGENYGKPI